MINSFIYDQNQINNTLQKIVGLTTVNICVILPLYKILFSFICKYTVLNEISKNVITGAINLQLPYDKNQKVSTDNLLYIQYKKNRVLIFQLPSYYKKNTCLILFSVQIDFLYETIDTTQCKLIEYQCIVYSRM